MLRMLLNAHQAAHEPQKYPCHRALCGLSGPFWPSKLFVDCQVLFGQVITDVDATSGHVLILKRFKILRSKTLHIQNTAHNMNGDDSDWEAFE